MFPGTVRVFSSWRMSAQLPLRSEHSRFLWGGAWLARTEHGEARVSVFHPLHYRKGKTRPERHGQPDFIQALPGVMREHRARTRLLALLGVAQPPGRVALLGRNIPATCRRLTGAAVWTATCTVHAAESGVILDGTQTARDTGQLLMGAGMGGRGL